MYHLYKILTGELISSASVISQIPDGMAIKESNKTGIWNVETLDFDPIVRDRILSRDDYLDLFTDVEMLSIVSASAEDATIKSSLDILNFRGRVRMNSENTIKSVNYMEEKGYIGAGRADEVLNG